MHEREVTRLNRRLGGLKQMRRLPNLLFIVDVRRDDLAVKEANVLGIPIIAMVDTNCDPDSIDYVIPSNDDAIRAIKLIVSTMANAVLEGHAILSTLQAEEEEAETMEDEQALERYLGPSTLAKIQAEAAADDEDEYEVEEYEEVEDTEDTEEEDTEDIEEISEEEVDITEAAETEPEAVDEPEVAETEPEAIDEPEASEPVELAEAEEVEETEETEETSEPVEETKEE